MTHYNALVLPIIALPAALMALSRFKLISPDTLVRLRRQVIFGFFIIAAIFTPPDALSQVVAGLALVGLYEISILCMRAAAT